MASKKINMSTGEISSSEDRLPPIPEIRQDSRRNNRGGALPFLGRAAGGGRGLFGLGAGLNAAKAFVLIAMAGSIGVTAAVGNYMLSRSMKAQQAQQKALAGQRASWLASARNAKVSGDVSRLPSDSGNASDGLSMFNSANRGGLNDGSSGASGAGGNAGDQANASASNGQADSQNVPAGNPLAGGNSGGSGQDSGFGGSRAGKLSGGLSNGALSGGSGMAAGIGRAFDQFRESNQGQLLAMARGANTSVAKTSSVGVRAVTTRQGWSNLNKLGSMNSGMKGTAGMANLQQASAIQTEQWSAKQPTGNAKSVIAGGDGTGISNGAADAPPSLSAQQGPNATPDNNPTPTPTPNNDTPYQSDVDLAWTLLLIASGLITLIGALKMAAKWLPVADWIMNTLLIGVMALAAVAMTLGVMVMTKYGQMGQGMIITLAAGIMMGAAAAAMVDMIKQPIWLVLAGIAGLATSIGSQAGERFKKDQQNNGG